MKLMEVLSKVFLLILLVMVTIGLYTLVQIERKSTKFYEHNNEKINLLQVKRIAPRVDYIITYKEDKSVDIFRKYSASLNEQEIQNIKNILEQANKSEFYKVEIAAYMKLDAQKIELFHSKEYLKKATKYGVNENMLGVLRRYGIDDFQYKNLEKLKDKLYEETESFLDDVVSYGKLKRTTWVEQNIPILGLGDKGIKFMSNIESDAQELALSEDEIAYLVESLEDALNRYKSIQ